MPKSKTFFVALLVLFIATVLYATFREYPGSALPFLAFNASWFAVIVLAFPQPRSFVYTFASILFSLGFWLKFTLHTIFKYPFVEPIGNFDNLPESWNTALLVSSSIAVGIIVARLLHLALHRRFTAILCASEETRKPPIWFIRYRTSAWILFVFSFLALNMLNLQAAFYQIGINPKIILPLHLNVLAAWLINIGFSLWLAVLVHYETSHSIKNLPKILVLPLIEALLSTASMLSRSIYIFHTLPYILLIVEKWHKLKDNFSTASKTALIGLLGFGFLLSLLLVSWIRIDAYWGYRTAEREKIVAQAFNEKKATAEQIESYKINEMAGQVLGLFADRWIGLEGVLAVSAASQKGTTLFQQGITENPVMGSNSIYQRLSKSNYVVSTSYTFLTIPGAGAIFYYSGSKLVVIFGIFAVLCIMMATETAISQFIGNPFLMSLTSLAMVNVITQMNYPYLSMVFFIELWLALLLIYFLGKLGTTRN